MRRRVYSYIRVSSKGQIDGDGLPRQREAVRVFCEQNSLDYCGEFAEKGVPGKTEAANRPAWLDMMDCVKNRKENGAELIEAIVVERMDRLARCLITSELLLASLRDCGIKLFATDQGLIDIASNDTDPTQKLIRQVIAAVAEFSKSELVKKLRLARERKEVRENWIPGRRPFRECPGGEIILDLILQRRSDGLSLAEIADVLNREGFERRKGGLWSRNNVFDVLKAHNNRKKLMS